MSIVESIPDATTFVVSLGDVCLACAFFGCILMLIEAGLVSAFREDKTAANAVQPPVTVLKPLHGVEPGLADRLAAFCRQDYDGPVQILCGARDSTSPSVAAVRAMQREHPDEPIELQVDPRQHGNNRKVSNLINMLPRARYATITLSDSDILVHPGYLRGVAALLASPGVGAVTSLYYGIGGGGFWARLSALAINSHFLPQAMTGIALKLTKPCFGATIALERSMLERIGGFGRFADDLADDYAIGMAVRAAGYEVATAPFLVGHCCFEDSLRQLLRRQIRVARTIKSIDPVGYAGSIITHPWPLALIGMLSGSPAAALVAVAALASRVAVSRCVERRFGLPREKLWLIPLQDFMAFAVYVASYFGGTVHWRGADYRVAADGTLIEEDLRRS
ncbi:MAG TPA: bacteriohopanetetrol glucosamine biosynthesis glycosyltransferase HpnI [Xanthobacteraceae bacterium]|nr:bacteriohopanetetrol glucosamine biosynthesis glycosyltransferase HpnI [Xanthobacteraceae bacterium]